MTVLEHLQHLASLEEPPRLSKDQLGGSAAFPSKDATLKALHDLLRDFFQSQEAGASFPGSEGEVFVKRNPHLQIQAVSKDDGGTYTALLDWEPVLAEGQVKWIWSSPGGYLKYYHKGEDKAPMSSKVYSHHFICSALRFLAGSISPPLPRWVEVHHQHARRSNLACQLTLLLKQELLGLVY